MQNPNDVTNPDDVNVADQAFAPALLTQTIIVGPSQNGGPTTQGISPVRGLSPLSSSSQTVVSGASQVGDTTIQGGTYSPQSANTINTTINNVDGQVNGRGSPENVFV